MDQDDSNNTKAASSTALFSTPSPSQCAAAPPSASKSKTPKEKGALADFAERSNFLRTIERDREGYEEVLHQKRMTSILNEVKWLEQTDWMYPSIESIYGFKDERPILLTMHYESATNLAEAHMFRVARGSERNT